MPGMFAGGSACHMPAEGIVLASPGPPASTNATSINRLGAAEGGKARRPPTSPAQRSAGGGEAGQEEEGGAAAWRREERAGRWQRRSRRMLSANRAASFTVQTAPRYVQRW